MSPIDFLGNKNIVSPIKIPKINVFKQTNESILNVDAPFEFDDDSAFVFLVFVLVEPVKVNQLIDSVLIDDKIAINNAINQIMIDNRHWTPCEIDKSNWSGTKVIIKWININIIANDNK